MSKLIGIKNFEENVKKVLDSKQKSLLFSISKDWTNDKLTQVAERCKIEPDLTFDNKFFENATLFSLLKENSEEIKDLEEIEQDTTIEFEEVDETIRDTENEIRRVVGMLKKPKLASLKKENMVKHPQKYKPPINFSNNKVSKNHGLEETEGEMMVELSITFMWPKNPKTKMAEFKVLGKQKLTELRDAFYCINDFMPNESNSNEQIKNEPNKKLSPSFFYFEKTFYNDKRHPNAIDYSKKIIEFLENHKDTTEEESQGKEKEYTSKIMDEIRFEDLSIRIGEAYLFCHSGNCEHLVYISEIKYKKIYKDTTSSGDIEEDYPVQTFRGRQMRHKCRMCLLYPACYVTTNDFHSGETPCYFCHECYQTFHYNSENKLILDHNVYPYTTTIL
ncbi:hypothetical protein BB559_005249 [Furculomyces boomerangus]|uniref:snRNA-activating protein complex subunit 3 n=1 Tax=Furculomyces boomerangus TaxID=61424 RepID=A0A2T9Y9S4_9FUNG|nr:hypothetical protein BB559_005249 [Furculomyces boomerangus]